MKNEKVTSSANLVKVKILHLSFVFLPEDVKINWQVTSSKLKSLKVQLKTRPRLGEQRAVAEIHSWGSQIRKHSHMHFSIQN